MSQSDSLPLMRALSKQLWYTLSHKSKAHYNHLSVMGMLRRVCRKRLSGWRGAFRGWQRHRQADYTGHGYRLSNGPLEAQTGR